jgi:tetratricopeptide (TPR) repeat protein
LVSKYERIRRQQILREAEGYLDLIAVVSHQWPLAPHARDRLAQRSLDALARLDRQGSCCVQARCLVGQALRIMERYAEAIAPLDEAAELDPENISIRLELGWCHKRSGRLDLAIQALEEALAVDGSEAIVHYNLACYWSLASNVKLALAYLGRAFELDSNYRDLVADEPDFDSIRNHPDFMTLTSVIV